jgi:protein disulfide-isomerase
LIAFLTLNVTIWSQEWKTDYKEAAALSQESGKPLLIAFLGSESCPWSKKMQLELLSDQKFLESLDAFILVKAGEQEQQRYSVEDFPALLIANTNQEEITRVGYMPISAGEFSEYLNEIVLTYRKIKEADLTTLKIEELQEFYFQSLKYGLNHFRHEIMTVGLKKDRSPFFLLEKYKLLVEAGKFKDKETLAVRKELIRRDPKNAFGVHRTFAIVDFHQLSNRYRLRKKPDAVAEPLLEYVKKYGEKDEEHLWKLEMMLAQFYFGRDKVAKSLKHAEEALKAAPEEAKAEIRQSIQYIRSKQAS